MASYALKNIPRFKITVTGKAESGSGEDQPGEKLPVGDSSRRGAEKPSSGGFRNHRQHLS